MLASLASRCTFLLFRGHEQYESVCRQFSVLVHVIISFLRSIHRSMYFQARKLAKMGLVEI
jgi:hypothetical protein